MPEFYAIHQPLYPSAHERVTLILKSSEGLASISLEETVFKLDERGNVIRFETNIISPLLESEFGAGYYIIRSDGYPEKSLVKYEFTFSVSEKKQYTRKVWFAIDPYVVADSPIPIYVIGNVNLVQNCVLISDYDLLVNTIELKDHINNIIRHSFHKEPLLRKLHGAVNFFLNPDSARAVRDNANENVLGPVNINQVSFAQVKMILHNQVMQDFETLGWCSSEFSDYKTIIHEFSHALFWLSDEYPVQDNLTMRVNDPYPNVWLEEDVATRTTDIYGDGVVRRANNFFWKICTDKCHMNDDDAVPLLERRYDVACKLRALYTFAQKIRYPLGDILVSRLPELINEYYVRHGGEFNPTFLNRPDIRHLGLEVIYRGGMFEITRGFVRPGVIPYPFGKPGKNYMQFRSSGKDLGENEFFMNPLNYSEMKMHLIYKKPFELLMPYNEAIIGAEFYKDNKIDFKINLDVPVVRGLFQIAWESDAQNGTANKDPAEHVIIYGGLFKHSGMKKEGLYLAISHEFAHLRGGLENKGSDCEAVADYIAAKEIMKIICQDKYESIMPLAIEQIKGYLELNNPSDARGNIDCITHPITACRLEIFTAGWKQKNMPTCVTIIS